MTNTVAHLRPARYFAEVTGQRPITVERQLTLPSALLRPHIVRGRVYLRVNEEFRFLERMLREIHLLPSSGPYGSLARALGLRAARTLRRRVRVAVERYAAHELEEVLQVLRSIRDGEAGVRRACDGAP